MKIYSFSRPSRPQISVPEHSTHLRLPPARSGDLLQAVFEGADAIVLIDDHFTEIGPKYHELIYVLQKGIPLVGAGYTGAVRAAELQSYGMRGVGAVYEQLLNTDCRNLSEVITTAESKNENFSWLSTQPATQWKVSATAPISKAKPFLNKAASSSETNLCEQDLYGIKKVLESLDSRRIESVGNRNPYAYISRLNKQFKLRPTLNRLAFGAARQNKNLTAQLFDRAALYLWLTKELDINSDPETLRVAKTPQSSEALLNCLGMSNQELSQEMSLLIFTLKLLGLVLDSTWVQERLTEPYLIKNGLYYGSLLLDSGNKVSQQILTLEDSCWLTEHLLSSHQLLDLNWKGMTQGLFQEYLLSNNSTNTFNSSVIL